VIPLFCILGYIVAGCLYGRSQVAPCYRAAQKEWGYGKGFEADTARESMAMRVAWRVVVWPAAMVFDAFRPAVKRWFTAQLDNEETS
jgi:hypothetical protein